MVEPVDPTRQVKHRFGAILIEAWDWIAAEVGKDGVDPMSLAGKAKDFDTDRIQATA